jgi:hypothetical protein
MKDFELHKSDHICSTCNKNSDPTINFDVISEYTSVFAAVYICKECLIEAVTLIEDYEETEEYKKGVGNERSSSVEERIMTDKEVIFLTVEDLVMDLLYYDRKEDEMLPRGAIQQAVKQGLITSDEIVDKFRERLKSTLKS